jgi:hypothetical protein
MAVEKGGDYRALTQSLTFMRSLPCEASPWDGAIGERDRPLPQTPEIQSSREQRDQSHDGATTSRNPGAPTWESGRYQSRQAQRTSLSIP